MLVTITISVSPKFIKAEAIENTYTKNIFNYWIREKNLGNILELRNVTYDNKLRKKTNLPDL